MVENKTTKKINMTNEIKVNETLVVSQTAIIDLDNPVNMTLSDYKSNKDLYKQNRAEIRDLMMDFEDAAYEMQDKVLAKEW